MSVGNTDPVTEDPGPGPRKSGRLRGWIGGWGAIGPGKALHSSCRSAQECSSSSPGAFHLQRVTRTDANQNAAAVLERSLVKEKLVDRGLDQGRELLDSLLGQVTAELHLAVLIKRPNQDRLGLVAITQVAGHGLSGLDPLAFHMEQFETVTR